MPAEKGADNEMSKGRKENTNGTIFTKALRQDSAMKEST